MRMKDSHGEHVFCELPLIPSTPAGADRAQKIENAIRWFLLRRKLNGWLPFRVFE
jgi:hypothetical protein